MTTGPLAFDLTLQRRSKPVRTSQAAAKIKARNANADRGKEAEAAVAKALAAWQKMISQTREVNRLLDTRAAGRVVRSAAADFEFFSGVDIKTHGLIEVKSTAHDYRLSRNKVPQLPRLIKRSHCGGLCGVLVYHTGTRMWRAIPVSWLESRPEVPSWDLRDLDQWSTAQAALNALDPAFFVVD